MDIWRWVRLYHSAHKGFYHFARRGDVLNTAHEPSSHTNSIFDGKNKVSYVIIVNVLSKVTYNRHCERSEAILP